MPDYFTLEIAIHRFADSYRVELRHEDPNSQASVAPQRGAAGFDLERLRELLLRPEPYGRALAEQLFAEPEILERFVQVETAAQASEAFLRVSMRIDPSAAELQSLRWELLRHPRSGALLATSERVLISRYIVSRDFRPVTLRAKAKLRALVAISAPSAESLAAMKLAPVDYEGELARASKALGGIELRAIGGPEDPFTVDRLMQELRAGVDLVYLVSHGKFGTLSKTPMLMLQDPDEPGAVKSVKAEELAQRFAELQELPRLMVLASCQSAGTGDQAGAASSVQATLAVRLADVGVPAILAMQGFITMQTVEEMMPLFFTELLDDGQIDRALAVARGRVRGRDDAWMPALYTRLLEGRLWYTAGFKGEEGAQVWQRLLPPVRAGKVVPILGPRLLEAVYGSAHQTARSLAGAKRYPFAAHDWDDLQRVTEFMKVTESRFNTVETYREQLVRGLLARHGHWLPEQAQQKPKLGKLLGLVGEHLREHNEHDVYRLLAELPASTYVTTNFGHLLELALAAADRKPKQLLSRWRRGKAPLAIQEVESPSASAPLVFHAYGLFGKPDGLVLTEDDYFDYMIETASGNLMPDLIETALVNNSLLFLGFRLTDWSFRVLFRLMMSLPGRELLRNYCHVAVQLDPDIQTAGDVEGAKRYLAKYFDEEARISIFWGTAEEFLAALHDELAARPEAASTIEADEEDDDEFVF